MKFNVLTVDEANTKNGKVAIFSLLDGIKIGGMSVKSLYVPSNLWDATDYSGGMLTLPECNLVIKPLKSEFVKDKYILVAEEIIGVPYPSEAERYAHETE